MISQKKVLPFAKRCVDVIDRWPLKWTKKEARIFPFFFAVGFLTELAVVHVEYIKVNSDEEYKKKVIEEAVEQRLLNLKT